MAGGHTTAGEPSSAVEANRSQGKATGSCCCGCDGEGKKSRCPTVGGGGRSVNGFSDESVPRGGDGGGGAAGGAGAPAEATVVASDVADDDVDRLAGRVAIPCGAASPASGKACVPRGRAAGGRAESESDETSTPAAATPRVGALSKGSVAQGEGGTEEGGARGGGPSNRGGGGGGRRRGVREAAGSSGH